MGAGLSVTRNPRVAEVEREIMSEGLAHSGDDVVAVRHALIGSPSTETGAKGAVEGDAVSLVGANGEGDVREGSHVLEAVAEGGGVGAVAKVTTDGGETVDEEIGSTEVGGGGDIPAVLVTGDAAGGELNVAEFDIIAEQAGRTGSRESGGRAEGEETEDR